MTQLQKQLKQVFPTLPDEIKTLLLSSDFNDRINGLAVKYGLTEAESGVVIRIVVRLLSGIMAPVEFVGAIIDNIEIERTQATQLAQEINRDIFNPVKDALKQLHNVVQEKTAEKPAAAVSAPQPAVAAPETVVARNPSTQNTPIPEAQPKIAVEPKPSVPFGAIPEAAAGKTESNNLESKLGGAFTIKKDVMFTAPSAPASPLQPAASPASANKPSAPLPQAAITAPAQAKTLDPYRELPS